MPGTAKRRQLSAVIPWTAQSEAASPSSRSSRPVVSRSGARQANDAQLFLLMRSGWRAALHGYAIRREIKATERPVLQKYDRVKGTPRMRTYDTWKDRAIFADDVIAQSQEMAARTTHGCLEPRSRRFVAGRPMRSWQLT